MAKAAKAAMMPQQEHLSARLSLRLPASLLLHFCN